MASFLSILLVLFSFSASLGGEGDSLLTVSKEKLVLNKKGQTLLPKELLSENFSDYTPVKVIDSINQGKVGFVDKKGRFIIAPSFDEIIVPFQNGFAILANRKTTKLESGVTDENGKTIVPFRYSKIERISNAVFACEVDGLYDFYNAAGEHLNREKLIDYQREDNLVTGKNLEEKKGVFDLNGKVLLPFEFKNIIKLDAGLEAEKFPVWKIQKGGKELFKFDADSFQSFQEGFIQYFRNGRSGLLKEDKVVIPSSMDEIKVQEPGLFKIKKGNYYGLVDTGGRIVVPVDFTSINKIGNGSLVKLTDKEGERIFDLNQRKVLISVMPSVHFLDSLTFAIKNKEGKWGVMQYSGKMILPFEYDSIGIKSGEFVEAGTLVDGNLEMGLLDSDQEWIICQGDLDLYNLGLLRVEESKDSTGSVKRRSVSYLNRYKYAFYEKLPNGFIKVKDHKGRLGLINRSGKELAEPVYDSLALVSDTLDLFFLRKAKNIGLIDGSGEFVFSFKDDVTEIHPFQNGHAAFKKKGLYGFIDLYGNIRVAPKYPKYLDFSDGYAAVVLLGKWGFVDKNEKIVVQPYYHQVKSFRKGVARVSSGTNKWKFIDSTGKDINGNVYNEIAVGDRSRYFVYKNGKVGLAEVNGKELIVPRYDKLKDYGNNIIGVKKDGKAGFIDEAGNFKIPMEYEEVAYDKLNDIYFLQTQTGEIIKFSPTAEKK